MDFNFMIKKSITEICNVKREENMNLLKQDILNPIVEHVMFSNVSLYFKIYHRIYFISSINIIFDNSEFYDNL